MANVITMILAGGQGTRLYPLTKLRSKPAVPIAGKFRLIDIPISNCIHSGYKQIFVCTQFAAESLHRHIFSTYRFDNFTRAFVTILSAQQTLDNRDWYQGTADAVRQNLRFIPRYGDHVLILSGDHLYRMDYRKFVDYHEQKKADITISVIPVSAEKASQFGIMKVDRDSRIVSFYEKPKDPELLRSLTIPSDFQGGSGTADAPQTHLASMGIYVFKKEVLFKLLGDTHFRDFGKEVIPEAIKKNNVFAYLFKEYWEDIGTIASFFEAHLDLTRPLPKFNFYDEERPIFTHPRFLPGAKVTRSEVVQSILCDGAIINNAVIRNSIIGIRSFIGENSHLEEVVMMGADYFETLSQKTENKQKKLPNVGIGKNCSIRRTIIDKNARIGNNVQLVNAQGAEKRDGENFNIRDGIIVIPKNAVIPDGTVI